ncbi:helix-turn-helix domain-containing protein [Pseudoteredinibacter isoporae]|uniref:helix-turn-helix domain-containing protein n=1 Tax=Pseudoteredinibacter isoporae TaxID=570281 RepID=UPI001AA0A658
MIKSSEETELSNLFKALGDASRRRIIDELMIRDKQSLFEICSRVSAVHGISSSRQALSRHLAVLESAGIITIEWKGTTKLHTLNKSRLSSLSSGWLSTFGD